MEALFTDSLPPGERSQAFTNKAMLMSGARVLGPALSIVFFLIHGNHWQLEELRLVLLGGASLAASAVLTLFYFNDDAISYVRFEYVDSIFKNG